MPRQTCGLYTHTIFMDKYPGGKQKLETSIRGGELFYSFVYNPVSFENTIGLESLTYIYFRLTFS